MIIKNKTGDEVVVEGESNVKKATISEGKLRKLQYILTKGLYTDPVAAVIVEITNNGIDGVVQAGKSPVENPVLVEIGTHRNGAHFFRVTDTGIGLDKDGFENVLMCYLESSKEEDEDSIGYFGLGSKSFLALDRAATFICRKNGMEYKYLAYQGAEFCEYDLLYEKKTKEGDGVIFEIEIKDRYERADFINKATNKLSYYDTAVLIIDGQVVENKIYRQDDFQWSNNCIESELHLCLKDVLYTIDWNKLGIPRIYVPMALRFGLSDGIIVTPSREGIILTEEVKEIIKKKICDVADWLGEKYNEGIVEFDNFPQAFPHLYNSSTFIELEGTRFYLNDLEKYMSFQLEDVKIKGVDNPRQAYINTNAWTSNFVTIGMIDYKGAYCSKNLYTYIKEMINYGRKGILLDQHPVGKVKEFIKQEYGSDTYFLLEHKLNLEDYKAMLSLFRYEKSSWREMIKQVQELHRQIREHFLTPLFNIRESEEFLTFEEEYRARALANKGIGVETTYKTLDKQEGEVTIALGRDPLIGSVPVFEKSTYVIADLPKWGGIMLLFSEEDKELAKNYHGLHKNLKTGIIGKREKTKLPETHQIMEKEKFEKTKLFKRIVTSMRIEDALNSLYKITNGRDDITYTYIKKLDYTKKKLEAYKYDNLSRNNMPRDVKDSFLNVAHEHNLWDESILPSVKKMEKALETFYFLEYVEIPRYGSEEDIRKVKKIINQLLIFQKKYGAFDNHELVEKPVPMEQLEYLAEQEELKEEFLNTPEAEMCMA